MYGHPMTPLSHDEAVHTLTKFKRTATLITAGAGGLKATQLPLLYAAPRDPRDRADFGRLIGRMALANDHWRDAEAGPLDALVLLAPPEGAAPGWNFETVHAHGKMRLFRGEGELRSILVALYDRDDSRRPPLSTPAPDYIARQIGAIIGVEIDLTRAAAKRRLADGQSAEDRAAMLQALEESNERELAAALRDV